MTRGHWLPCALYVKEQKISEEVDPRLVQFDTTNYRQFLVLTVLFTCNVMPCKPFDALVNIS